MPIKTFQISDNNHINRSNESVASYFRDVRHCKPVSADEEVELVRTIRKGGADAMAAREKLIKANLRFVISVANSYHSSVLELGDLINEGNIGLMKAVDEFDETRGFKFISYAVWWIRQSILEAISNTSTGLRLPHNKQSILRSYLRMGEDMMKRELRSITVDEFCEVSGYKPAVVMDVLSAASMPVNTSTTLNDDSETTVGEMLKSDSVADESFMQESLRKDINNAMDMLLSDREAFVLKSLFGIGKEEMFIEDVADEINLSRERTRQICHNALAKIRRSPFSKHLASYLAA